MNRSQRSRRRWPEFLAERVLAATMGTIVLAMIVFALYHGFSQRSVHVPDIRVTTRVEGVVRRGGERYLPVDVRNASRPTVADVLIRVIVQKPDGEADHQEFIIDYLPENSSHTGYVRLPDGARQSQAEAAVVSYSVR